MVLANITYILYINVHTACLAQTSPNIRPYTLYTYSNTYGSGQPYLFGDCP